MGQMTSEKQPEEESLAGDHEAAKAFLTAISNPLLKRSSGSDALTSAPGKRHRILRPMSSPTVLGRLFDHEAMTAC